MPETWNGLRAAVLSLAEVASIRDGKLCLDLSPLLVQPVVPHPDARTPHWLTVTEAAALLAKDLPGLDHDRAKARVSAAASRRSFKTNNRTREARRIERDSFNSWRLAQRDKDLDAEDDEEPDCL